MTLVCQAALSPLASVSMLFVVILLAKHLFKVLVTNQGGFNPWHRVAKLGERNRLPVIELLAVRAGHRHRGSLIKALIQTLALTLIQPMAPALKTTTVDSHSPMRSSMRFMMVWTRSLMTAMWIQSLDRIRS